MQEDHFIEWIEASNGKETSRIFLKFGQKPEAEFTFKPKYARIHCNIHGLWKSEQKNEG
jgi:superoxide reductase